MIIRAKEMYDVHVKIAVAVPMTTTGSWGDLVTETKLVPLDRVSHRASLLVAVAEQVMEIEHSLPTVAEAVVHVLANRGFEDVAEAHFVDHDFVMTMV